MPEARDTDFQAFQSPHEASVEKLVEALDRAYHRPGLLMWRAFLQGLMTALGMTVGYALIVIALAYAIQVHGGIGKLLDPLINQIQSRVIPASLQSQLQASNSPEVSLSPEQLDQLQKIQKALAQ